MQAQKIFGNRWTEIAKVVTGRTDNAVKNRFTTLCKKRAKHEALSKENGNVYINANNKRVILDNGCAAAGTYESTTPLKKIRTHVSDPTENCNMKSVGGCGTEKQQMLRPPLAALVQNLNKGRSHPTHQHVLDKVKMALNDVSNNKDRGILIRRDDPKMTALMQQAELLSSLALKVNTDNTDQSLENAWKELQDFLIQTEESELLRCKILEMDFLLEGFKDLVQDMKGGSTGSRLSWRQPDLHEESQGSSEYSTGSTHQWHSVGELIEGNQAEECSLNHNINTGTNRNNREVEISGGCGDGFCCSMDAAQEAILPSCDEPRDNDGIVSAISNTDFNSPLQMFQSFGEGIPSPKFSDSERHFLLRTLGLASPSATNVNTNPSCKRALHHSL
ncbi:transcription factor MYB124-like isoform X2 [Magnolia sinica]|uniref:transcription factor MYB124-like isoform X2 n=1 Tax=Magnolia sinica TaxID=86752 RepID=UPI00265950A6|nr:transcription factor MYB124-like isoform X2 [Magnolia sinica]